MQRPQPLPEYPAGQTVIRTTATYIIILATYTGDLTIQHIVGGITQTTVRPASDSGQVMSINTTPGTDIILTGDLQRLSFNSGTENFVAVGHELSALRIQHSVKTLDLRSGTISFIAYSPYGVETLYAKATSTTMRDLMIDIINNSPNGNTLWIKSSDAYVSDVVAVAKAHGWKVYYL